MTRLLLSPESRDELEYLIEKTQQGDQPALCALLVKARGFLEHMMKRIWPGARHRTHSDGDDLVQEALIAVYHAIDPAVTMLREKKTAFRGENAGQFMSWLSRILTCKAADAMRRAAYRNGLKSLTDLDLCQTIDRRTDVMFDDENERSEVTALLRAAIDRLPNDSRKVVWLRWFRGLRFADIAEHLGRPEPTIRSLHQRALRRLASHAPLRRGALAPIF